MSLLNFTLEKATCYREPAQFTMASHPKVALISQPFPTTTHPEIGCCCVGLYNYSFRIISGALKML